MPTTKQADDLPASWLHMPGYTYVSWCMTLAPFMLVFEGFYRAWHHRKTPPKGRTVLMKGIKMHMFGLGKQSGPRIVSRQYDTYIGHGLQYVRDMSKIQSDVLKLIK
uniref:Uncharacterized protein n=1 Tax=Eutreptiella gymnastica TaxID=73025 RepID=A0A7S4GI46_9EUGL|eukprot:CAMPEP_0174285094 /NCGR_PEP_ID=MMETSP0809-20121228/7580_1 /TAXON_ID=73025 ORGANISM="Eutreptiella gymnastica-like, Strain CCMP1594" /NCGR_SAMPLE_ID=MMETSP0809 /ASSEMBLY_ACC=CAM_ASM_000658 /LENGTH=106 /DNA_ID=CAMNT_0015380783 /DNA_START=32 /DNA_END=352 /DNA_ORIENTATION=+